MAAPSIREAVGVFADAQSLRTAADALMRAGFDRSLLSMLGTHDVIVEKLGRMYGTAAEVEDDPRVPTMAYVGSDSVTEAKAALVGIPAFIGAIAALGPSVAAGATTTAVFTWVVGGTLVGGVLGLICANVLASRRANYFQDQLDRGGILLWVRTASPEEETKACDILKQASAQDVHVHNRPVIQEFGFVYGYLDRLSGLPDPAEK